MYASAKDDIDNLAANAAKPDLISSLEQLQAPPPPLPISAYDPSLEIDKGDRIRLAGRHYTISTDPAATVGPW